MLIVDIPMPKKCAECPLLIMGVCMLLEDVIKCKTIEKTEKCPIKGELVRCKDCRWACLAPQRQTATCMKNRLPFTHDYDWFCADGERKDGADDGRTC